MVAQSVLHLDVESAQADFSRDVFSGRRTRLIWFFQGAAAGFAGLMLIGLAAPLISHASEETSHQAAFSPAVPVFAPGIRPASTGMRPAFVTQGVSQRYPASVVRMATEQQGAQEGKVESASKDAEVLKEIPDKVDRWTEGSGLAATDYPHPLDDDYKFGDITKRVIRDVSGNTDYEFGDATKAAVEQGKVLSEASKASAEKAAIAVIDAGGTAVEAGAAAKKALDDSGYQFGDLTKGAIKGFEEKVREATGNDEYKFGDVTKNLAKGVFGALEKGAGAAKNKLIEEQAKTQIEVDAVKAKLLEEEAAKKKHEEDMAVKELKSAAAEEHEEDAASAEKK